MFGRLRPAEWLTSLGVAVLFASTFEPWFRDSSLDSLSKLAPDARFVGGPPAVVRMNVWDLSVTRWFVYGALVTAAWMVIAALFGETPHWALVLNTPALALSFAAAVGLTIRLISPPAGATVLTAYWAAFAGGLLLLAGTAWALRDETIPSAYLQSPPPEHVDLDV